MRMKPSQYLRIRARAIFEGDRIPHALDRDWVDYVLLVIPDGEEWTATDTKAADRAFRCCLAASIAEAEGK